MLRRSILFFPGTSVIGVVNAIRELLAVPLLLPGKILTLAFQYTIHLTYERLILIINMTNQTPYD